MTLSFARRRRLLVFCWVAGLLAVLVAATLMLALRPQAIQARVIAELERLLSCRFEMRSVSFSLLSGVEIRDLGLWENEGGDAIASIALLRVRPRLFPLLLGRFEPRKVTVDGLNLRVRRGKSGSWNVAKLLRMPATESAQPLLRQTEISFPELILNRCRVSYDDEHTFGAPLAEEIESLRLSLLSTGDPRVLLLEGEAEGGLARRVHVSGRCVLENGALGLEIRAEAFKLDLAGGMDRFLPAAAAERYRSLDVRGSVDVVADVLVSAERGVVPTRIEARIVDAGLAIPGLPWRAAALSGNVVLRESVLEVSGCEGKLGEADLKVEARAELAPDRSGVRRWSARVDLAGLHVDAELRERLGQEAQAVFDEFQPSGRVSVRLEVPSSSGDGLRMDDLVATVRLEGLAFRYFEFPYLVEDARGEIEIRDRRMTFTTPIVGRCGGGEVEMLASSHADLSPVGEINLQLRVGGVQGEKPMTIDAKLRDALPRQGWAIWDDLQPSGIGRAEVEVLREPAPYTEARAAIAGDDAQVIVRAYPIDAQIRYQRFPYEVTNLGGEIHVDTQSLTVTLKGIEGRHGEQRLRADGAVSLGEQAMFRIDLKSDDLAVDADLLAALPVDARELADDFGFRGRVKADVRVYSVPGGVVEVAADLDVLAGSVLPRQLPYAIEVASGRIMVTGGSTLRLIDWITPAGAEPSVALNASVTSQGSRRQVDYDVTLDTLRVDDRLLSALPAHLKSFVSRFGLRGTFAGNVGGYFSFEGSDPSKNRVYYEGRGVRSRDATVDFGVRIRDMVATGRFFGGHSPEQPDHFWGDVFVESAWFNRLNLTNGDIQFSFGAPHAHVLADSRRETVPGRTYELPAQFVGRLADPAAVRDTFQMSVRSKDMYGGAVDGFLYVDTGSAGDIGGDFVAHDLQLWRAARDVFRVEPRDVKGLAGGRVRFQGRAGDIKSLRGEGEGEIREAQLVELPLFFGIFSLLKLNLADAAGGSFFSTMRLPYRIESGRFVSDAIEIRSSGLTLRGSGTMTFEGGLDLTFRPRFFNFEIPLVEEVFGLVKQALSRVRVRGDLAAPQTEFVTAAGLLRLPLQGAKPAAPPTPLPQDVRKE